MSNNDGMAPVPFVAGRTSGSRSVDNSRVQHLRNLLQSDRHMSAEQRRAIDALDREMLEMAGEPIPARMNRRTRGLEAQSNEHDTAATPSTPPAGSPMALQRRRRIIRPSERLARIRSRMDAAGNTADAMEETFAGLDRPPPPIEPTDIAIQEYMGEAQFHRETRWRAKRRKLDDGSYEEEAKTFSYGHNGQVVTGPLRLEIAACDGGAYSEPDVGSSWPQNVLQDDIHVYCTKSNHCNMLLKHVGGMPFSLTKIVVKAPRHGYDSPIQEGMIFVAMDDEKILERTASYEIRYSPQKSRSHYRRETTHMRFGSSREYMNSARSPLRSIDRASYLRDPYSLSDIEDAETGLQDVDLVPDFVTSTTYDDASDNEGSIQRSPRMRRPSASYYADADRHYMPPTGYSDYYRPTYHDTDNEGGSSSDSDPQRRTSYPDLTLDGIIEANRPSRRMRQLAERYSAQIGNPNRDELPQPYRQLDPNTFEYFRPRLRTRPSRIEMRPSSRRQDTPDVHITPEVHNPVQSPIPNPPPPVDSTSNQQDRHSKTESDAPDTLKPHARFFIRRDKSSVTINFEPAVAGRFILIKLWAPCPKANIDIKSIIAHGYGGPRFFPAYEPH